ncbi:hypothetical protein NC653_008819 [Populus alba x Populus x berolinensis]|uniref:Uncharacterized protein n=1 Tax=Populus alba x Populus x berolinensis TaxID=444605 RepID=A0AAD6W9G6_9ROSI|nr:hypothetical protein NC653_008819 [Populus alba x Populus x berolinensis]
MLATRVHFGHTTRKYNLKMAPYISTKQVCDLVFDATSRRKQFFIVGIKNNYS